MQENRLFEYAVIRVVPRVEREEFLNVGVILWCSAEKFLQVRISLDETRLKLLCAKLDMDELRAYVRSFERICQGGPGAGPIGKLPPVERFRWLTATRSTIVQCSRVHPGLSPDACQMLDRLYAQLVLPEH
ncbi:DUF3037 domain-containing protein [Parachryseolinea silvisoli]|uniref:DUF3037 domain-containing protein n=1 Tax=Parachryseolinea silvisoli TaxID=2873601 RepID=UPI002265CD3E|nr:DUF3037 domain-containing protein [Parachryseolinea silvisoli]MCD9016545.1 DUF3037 domain-containing protein [Parachryseolinea silvisoli]